MTLKTLSKYLQSTTLLHYCSFYTHLSVKKCIEVNTYTFTDVFTMIATRERTNQVGYITQVARDLWL